MKIVKDELKQLNYHPLVVYFMLQPKEYDTYAAKLEKLGTYKGFSRGIYKFKAVERGSDFSRDLDANLAYALSRANVVLRLVDDIDGNFNYALDKIKFKQEPELFEQSVLHFVNGASEQNVKNLDARLTQYDNDDDDRLTLSSIRTEFENAIAVRTLTRGVWSRVMNPVPRGLGALKARAQEGFGFARLYCVLPPDIVGYRDSVYKELTPKGKEEFNKIWAYFESLDIPTRDESDKYAQGTIDDSKSSDFSLDQMARHKHGNRPNITITIDKVVPPNKKAAKKCAFGFVFNIDGEEILVYLGDMAAAMVYMCTLLKQMDGSYIHRSAFKHGDNRNKDVSWLEHVYDTIFPWADETFDSWYKKCREKGLQVINQGKGHLNREIKKALASHPNAIGYCCVEKGGAKDSYYYIDVPAENIRLSKLVQEKLMATK